MKRWTLFWAVLLGSLALSALLWQIGVPVFFGALVFPFLFWPRGQTRTCPTCGYTTMHPAVRYCPSCGERLADTDDTK